MCLPLFIIICYRYNRFFLIRWFKHGHGGYIYKKNNTKSTYYTLIIFMKCLLNVQRQRRKVKQGSQGSSSDDGEGLSEWSEDGGKEVGQGDDENVRFQDDKVDEN